jgi:SNF2 family DNA or RNA helicase
MCRDCYEKHLNDEITQGKPQCNCPRCGKIAAQIVRSGGELNANRRFPGRPGPIKLKTEVFKTQDGRSISIVPAGEPKNLSPGDDYNGIQPKMSNSSCRWLGRCDKLGQVPPSTKTNAAIETVGKWQKEAPNDKIVIFTEWITTANVLGRMLHRANINFVYYNGQIPIKERERSLKCFEENPDIKVLVGALFSKTQLGALKADTCARSRV